MASLSANGYFDEEPLVAVPTERRPGYYTVVEGNRRLGALKLLLDDRTAAKLKIRNIPAITPDRAKSLGVVPVKIYDTRAEVLPYLGFRHITGIKEWDADAKARYIYQLHHENNIPLDTIADMIGDTYKITQRLYLGWSLLRQAESELDVSEDDFYKFPFSYMYDAVRTPQVKEYLSLAEGKFRVPKSNLPQLQELIVWLFGSKHSRQQPIVDRKEQIKELAYVVSDKRATSALRRGATLDEAYRETIGEREQLSEWLTRASRDLDKAKGVLHRHRTDIEVRDLIHRCSQTMAAMMRDLGS